jgi:hypothetical protein
MDLNHARLPIPPLRLILLAWANYLSLPDEKNCSIIFTDKEYTVKQACHRQAHFRQIATNPPIPASKWLSDRVLVC